MKDSAKRPVWLRALGAFCAVALLSSATYRGVAGFHFAALAIVALAIAGVATPVVMGQCV